MPDSVSNDRAIEALAHAQAQMSKTYRDTPSGAHWRTAKAQVEALAGAGLQITDLTADELTTLIGTLQTVWPEETELLAKLRRISGGSE